MLKYVLLLLVGCKSSAGLDADLQCADAIKAMDADGDLYIPDGELPKDCDLSWEDALGLVAEDGYQAGDCDDSDDSAHPGAEDICGDDLDQDCDGELPQLSTRYTDDDGDGFGDPATAAEVCGAPAGTVDNADDCDDFNPEVNPDAVETTCGPDVTDANCDGLTDCAVSGTMSAEAWGVIAGTADLGGGAGLSMDADPEGPVLVGGSNGAWLVTGDGRQVEGEEITIEGSVSAGADVCLLDDVDGDGESEVVVGDPGFDEAAGRVTVGQSNPAQLTSGRLYLGAETGAADGLVASVSFDDEGNDWTVYLVMAEGLPVAGESEKISDVNATETPFSAAGSAEAPPSLSIAPAEGGWLVAVGQPKDEDGDQRVVVRSLVSGATQKVCIISSTTAGTTLGTSVLLADITGDDVTDLIVGDPDAKAVYVFENPADCGDTALETSAATFRIRGAAVADFGNALASVPDMNGDGIDDLVVGGTGAAALILGGADISDPYAILEGPAGFGASVAGADLDGDGFGDLIIGDAAGTITALWGGPPA